MAITSSSMSIDWMQDSSAAYLRGTTHRFIGCCLEELRRLMAMTSSSMSIDWMQDSSAAYLHGRRQILTELLIGVCLEEPRRPMAMTSSSMSINRMQDSSAASLHARHSKLVTLPLALLCMPDSAGLMAITSWSMVAEQKRRIPACCAQQLGNCLEKMV